MPAVAGTHAPGRVEGVEGLRGWVRHAITYLSNLLCVRVKDNAKWWKN